MNDHRKQLDEWMERSAKVLQDYGDWRDSLDPRTVGLPTPSGRQDLRTVGLDESSD